MKAEVQRLQSRVDVLEQVRAGLGPGGLGLGARFSGGWEMV